MEKIYAVVDIANDPNLKGIRPFQTFGDLVNVIVRNSLVIAGIIAFILLIVAGFQFIVGAGSGDPKKFEQTRTTILIVLIGLILVVAAVWIVQIVEKLTGLNLLSPT
ncbi:hypothetical protein HYV22_03725 [Candidatus Gottesmanbacteria bacterium]|nr:hypothetical protein [Candidatus Gottesmanbacteria bacterium]